MALYKRLTKKQRRQIRHVLIALLVGFTFLTIVALLRPFSSIEWGISDKLFLPTNPSPNIVIAAIDDASLEEYGKWSDWPRSLHAQAIDNLSQAGAMAIGFDVLFTDETDDDPLMAQAIANASNVVLAVAGDKMISSPQPGINYENMLHPTEELANASAALGQTTVSLGGGGVVREIPLAVRDAEGNSYLPLTLALLYTFFIEPLPQDYDMASGAFPYIFYDIPVDGEGDMRINYVGPPRSFPQLSYADIIDGTFDPEIVKHKMVLVGMTATGHPDSWVTPMAAEKMYGVEIHANALDTILRERFLMQVSRSITLLTVFLMMGVLGMSLPFLNMRWGSLLTVLLIIGYLMAVFFAFDSGYVLNALYPLLAAVLVYVTIIICRVASAQGERRAIRELFGRYVSPQVAGEILHLANADKLRLGGVRREITVLFADIRGFTTWSEQEDPETIVATLNSYLKVVIERILANGGMINKFAGDSIMAVWNAPQDQPDYALLAVKAAIESQQAIEDMPLDEIESPVQFGMGINSGPAVAGNVGAEGRSEYTIIGDTVNLAARLCGNAPGGQVWLGVDIYEQVKDAIDVEELEPQYFKGKAEPVTAYRVLGLRRDGGTDE